MKPDRSKFRLDRFKEGDEVVVWKGLDIVDGTSAHGKPGIVKNGYVEIEGKKRVYFDSGACFMTDAEFALYDVMCS